MPCGVWPRSHATTTAWGRRRPGSGVRSLPLTRRSFPGRGLCSLLSYVVAENDTPQGGISFTPGEGYTWGCPISPPSPPRRMDPWSSRGRCVLLRRTAGSWPCPPARTANRRKSLSWADVAGAAPTPVLFVITKSTGFFAAPPPPPPPPLQRADIFLLPPPRGGQGGRTPA